MVKRPENQPERPEAPNGGEADLPADGRFAHNPIASRSGDRLGRAEFARNLGQALVRYPSTGSLVVALYGDWGSGKTSTLNMAFETIMDTQQDNPPLVVWFNPWWYSNTGELLARFFEQLGEEIGHQLGESDLKDGQAIKEKLHRYGKLLTPLGGLVDLFGGAGTGTVIAKILEQGLVAALGDAGETKVASIQTLREEISRALLEYERPVVVVIDDMDRLAREEIRDIFRLVKAVADFPNTRYLLAFDRGTVVGALSGVQSLDGGRYLEKMVQVPFFLPYPSNEQLWNLVLEGVEEILVGLEAVSSEERAKALGEITALAYYSLDLLFSNMRQVNRFLGSLRFTLPPICTEIRLSEFVVLEALRLNHPEAYVQIVNLQQYLLGTGSEFTALVYNSESSAGYEKIFEDTKGAVQEILDHVEQHLHEPLSKLLEVLFPRVEAARRGYPDQADSLDWWTVQKRVCVQEVFRIATGWYLSTETISTIEVERILAIQDSDRLRQHLAELGTSIGHAHGLQTLLRKLGPYYRASASNEARSVMLHALLGMVGIDDIYTTTPKLALDIVKGLPDSRTRKEILCEAVERSGVSTALVRLLGELGREHGWYRTGLLQEERRTLSSADLERVLGPVSEKIASEATSGQLIDRGELFDEYLRLWSYARGMEEPKEYLGEILERECGIVDLLEVYADTHRIALEGWGERGRYSSNGRWLEIFSEFMLLKKALEAASELLEEYPHCLHERQRSLLAAFVNPYSGQP